MLVFTRKPGETIRIGDDIVVTFVNRVGGVGVKIGIDAPREIPVHRGEVTERIKQQEVQSGQGGTSDGN